MADKIHVLFLCTGNSCRSQMAEGWARQIHGHLLEPTSAGTEPKGLDPRAVRLMAEVGVDISRQRSRPAEEVLKTAAPDCLVTVCSRARETCPVFPDEVATLHRSFDDPAQATGSEEEVLATFRRVRDEIRSFVEGLPELLDALREA